MPGLCRSAFVARLSPKRGLEIGLARFSHSQFEQLAPVWQALQRSL